ncbi:MAG: DUF4386 family protein [Anaerolineales bacterium]|nr:DUF4386 family protein [Anaerolineales bacterium]
MERTAVANIPDSAYTPLRRAGGWAAIIAAALTLAEVVAFAVFPPPETVGGWFALFQSNPAVGLLDFWGLEIPMYGMFALAFLALYAVLGKADESRMAVVIALALLGVGIFLATNNPVSMMSLSGRHAAAATEAERSVYLAAGQTLLINTGQRAIGGFNMGLLLVSAAGLLVSTVMLRSGSFSRATAWVGIFAHGLSLADYVRQALTSSDIILLLVVLPNALLLVSWYIMVGRGLLRPGSADASPSTTARSKPEASRRNSR